MDRQPGLVRQQFEEIGCRPLQSDLERALVDRPDAEVLEAGAFAGLVDLLGIADRVEDVGVFRAGFGIDHAPEREDEVPAVTGSPFDHFALARRRKV